MAIASVPAVVSNQRYGAWRVAQRLTSPGCSFNHLGMVTVNPGDNTTVPLGGMFDVWYCPATHSLLIDITDAQSGGPV